MNMHTCTHGCICTHAYRYMPRADEADVFLRAMLEEGTLRLRSTVWVGLERAPAALIGLLTGDNIGKALIRV